MLITYGLRNVRHILEVFLDSEGAVGPSTVDVIAVGVGSLNTDAASFRKTSEGTGINDPSLVALAADEFSRGSPDFDRELKLVAADAHGGLSDADVVHSLERVLYRDKGSFAHGFAQNVNLSFGEKSHNC